MRGEPRNLRVMSTEGANVHGLRATLEETLLEILRDKSGALPNKVQGLVGVDRNKLCGAIWRKLGKGTRVGEG